MSIVPACQLIDGPTRTLGGKFEMAAYEFGFSYVSSTRKFPVLFPTIRRSEVAVLV